MAFDVGSVIAKVDADISGFKKGMADAKDEANGLGSHLKNIGNGIADFGKQAAIFTGVATAAIVAFGKSSVDSYNESQAGIAQLEAVLKSTGGVAGVTADQAIKLASAFQKTTKFSDETTLSAENMLLTFTNIKSDIFPEATKMVLDMSQALGQDTKSSAIQLGKALQDPILGVTALRRVGVNFNKESQDTIKNLVETGKSAEAQAYIMKELKTEFGGSAEAAGKTFGGQLVILRNRFDDVKESIGQVIAGFAEMVMTDDAGTFAAGLENLGIKSEGVITFFGQLAGAIRDLAKWIGENKELVLTFLTGLAIGLGALMIIGAIAGMIALFTNPLFILVAAVTALYVAFQTNFLGIHDIVMFVINQIKWFIDNILMPAFQAFSTWFTNVLAPAITAVWTGFIMPMFQAFVGWFKERWEFIKDMIDGVWQIISGIIKVAWALVSGIITVGLQILTGNWAGAWDTIKKKAGDVWDGLKGIFNGAVDFIKGWGGMVLHELTKPFEDAWNRIKELVENIKNKLDFTKRNSPSVVDIIKTGVGKVNEALGDLAYGATFNANAAGAAVSYGGNQNSTVVVKVDLAGAIITDAFGASQMAELVGDGIIKRLQQQVRI